ncbi:transcription initiation factor TFIID subunit 7-like isoform X2 [Chelonus insularis]|nr:transcription initiation factor TFIID subunit 7-like isoform X2 [Chelonus insularis]XP_034952641.1 transcription initiation factor TFIID subunit 7-like isoform X2 [Chelonus insularis]
MRYGEIRLDNWILHAKVVDLPTIVESLKTMDHKSFYKTADICQMVICKEEDDRIIDEKVQVEQPKQKDSNKVDRQFWWPHGVTPPLKNVRKRRFRKVLKKKIVETLEIEKEIKRLLQVDNDAVNVRWEVIYEEIEDIKSSKCSNSEIMNEKTETNSSFQSVDLISRNTVEHDIFGEAISDSDDENEKLKIDQIELDESSQLSIDSQHFDFNSNQGTDSQQSQQSTDR